MGGQTGNAQRVPLFLELKETCREISFKCDDVAWYFIYTAPILHCTYLHVLTYLIEKIASLFNELGKGHVAELHDKYG